MKFCISIFFGLLSIGSASASPRAKVSYYNQSSQLEGRKNLIQIFDPTQAKGEELSVTLPEGQWDLHIDYPKGPTNLPIEIFKLDTCGPSIVGVSHPTENGTTLSFGLTGAVPANKSDVVELQASFQINKKYYEGAFRGQLGKYQLHGTLNDQFGNGFSALLKFNGLSKTNWTLVSAKVQLDALPLKVEGGAFYYSDFVPSIGLFIQHKQEPVSGYCYQASPWLGVFGQDGFLATGYKSPATSDLLIAFGKGVTLEERISDLIASFADFDTLFASVALYQGTPK